MSSPVTLRYRGGHLLFWKSLEYAGLAAYLLIVPRLMGPDLYGQFAVLLAWKALLLLPGGLGSLAIFGRFLPEYLARDERQPRELFTQVFVVRTAAAALLAVVAFLSLRGVMPAAGVGVALMGALAVLASGMAAPCYQLFLGLNRPDRWLSRQSLRRPLLIALLVALGAAHSFGAGGLALALSELLLLALGLWWVRGQFVWSASVLDQDRLRRHFGFGVRFFAANLLALAIWRSGEVVLSIAGVESASIGHFSIAVAAVGTLAALLAEMSMLLVPSATALRLEGRGSAQEELVAKGLRVMFILAVVLASVLQLVGAWLVGTLLGVEFLGVATPLRILALALLPVALLRTAIAVTLIEDSPRRAVWITGCGLAAYLLASVGLVARLGGQGVAVAVVVGLGTSAVVALRRRSVRRLVLGAGLSWWISGGLSALAAQWWLSLVESSWQALPPLIFGLTVVALGWLNRADLRRLLGLLGTRLGSSGGSPDPDL